NTSETSPSGNVHGMPLSALMGEGSKELVNLYHPGNKVNPENVFLIATRDLDKGEQEMIKQKKLNVYSMETIHKKKIAFVVEDIKKRLLASKVKNIHLSIDIDSIDPDFAPGTGTKVTDGLTVADFYEVIDGILSLNVVKSIDLVELNPLLDDKKDSTTRLCIDIIDFITKRI
ncbi:MAG: arginase family protein, partial [Rikenellaceae bacterium]